MSDNGTPVILLTRPRAAAERFAAACRQRFTASAKVVIAPLMETLPVPAELEMERVSGLIFTSAVAVEIALTLIPRRDLTAWCVGDRTADAARAAGFNARSAGGNADDLCSLIITERPTGTLLHLRGRHVRGDVAQRLTEAGLRARDVVIYDQTSLPPPNALFDSFKGPAPVLVPLFSPRSAQLFAATPWQTATAPLRCVALSEAVRQALPQLLRNTTQTAERPDSDAMLRALATLISH